MKAQVATCGVCEEPIYLEVDEGEPTDQLLRELRQVEEQHLQTHPAPVLALFALRQVLPRLTPSERALRVRQVYRALLSMWGDEDQRGVYSIDEALGSAACYRLWMDAERCGYAGCRHAP